MLVLNDMNDFYTAVLKFNTIGGNLSPVQTSQELTARLRNQAMRVLEEAQEVVDGESAEEVLDGVIDTLVTAFGLLQMLAPYAKTKTAAELICHNNLSKFIEGITEEQKEENIAFYAEQGIAVAVQEVEYEGVKYGVIRRLSDNKIMKPKGFVAVSLEGLA